MFFPGVQKNRSRHSDIYLPWHHQHNCFSDNPDVFSELQLPGKSREAAAKSPQFRPVRCWWHEHGAGGTGPKRLPSPASWEAPAKPCDCKRINPAAQSQPRQEALSWPCPQAQAPLGKDTARARPAAAHLLLDGRMQGSPGWSEKTPL